MKFEGIYTPAVTPLSPDGQIDKEATDTRSAMLDKFMDQPGPARLPPEPFGLGVNAVIRLQELRAGREG